MSLDCFTSPRSHACWYLDHQDLTVAPASLFPLDPTWRWQTDKCLSPAPSPIIIAFPTSISTTRVTTHNRTSRYPYSGASIDLVVVFAPVDHLLFSRESTLSTCPESPLHPRTVEGLPCASFNRSTRLSLITRSNTFPDKDLCTICAVAQGIDTRRPSMFLVSL